VTFAPLTDPLLLARQRRDYMYWRRPAGRRHPKSPGKTMDYGAITLPRGLGIHGFESRGTFTLQLAEAFTRHEHDVVLEFKAVGMREDDALNVALNGHDIPASDPERFHAWDGHNFRGEHEPYELFRVRPNHALFRWGGHELAVTMRNQAHKGDVRIKEVNLQVLPR